jgi:OPA family glycerol-3-phosphate transporter-like MFS transporter
MTSPERESRKGGDTDRANAPAVDEAASKKLLRKWQIRILGSTWLAYVGYYFCRKAFYVVKADMERVLHFMPRDIGHVGTAYLACYMIGQFGSAYAGRKLGPKLLLLVGMGLSIGCNVAFGISNGFWTVMLFMAINGLAQGTGWPGCIGSLAFWFKRKQRGSVLGVWATCYQVGSIAATSFAAFMLGAAGWRWSFFGASAVLLVIWFVVLVFHPNRPEEVGLEPVGEDGDDEGEKRAGAEEQTTGERSGLKALGWSRRVVLTIALMGTIYFCIKFLRYALWSWTAYFLRKSFGLDGDEAGYLTVIFDACGFAGVLFAGFASDKLFEGRRALLSFLMLAGMFLAFIWLYYAGSNDLIVFAICLGLVGFGLYGPDSLLSGVGAIDVGTKRGALAAAGIINGMGSIGPIFQEQLVGWMYGRFDRNLEPIFFVLMAVAGVGTAFTFALWVKAKLGRARI